VKCGKMFPVRNIIGKQVKMARHRFKPRMTQAALAVRLQLDDWDIDRSGVAKIELGLRQVTDIEVMKLAKALNVSASWLLGETK
jgi:transcriptional regulator with XRE-family HTH domain